MGTRSGSSVRRFAMEGRNQICQEAVKRRAVYLSVISVCESVSICLGRLPLPPVEKNVFCLGTLFLFLVCCSLLVLYEGTSYREPVAPYFVYIAEHQVILCFHFCVRRLTEQCIIVLYCIPGIW